jgi:hypothetical protein
MTIPSATPFRSLADRRADLFDRAITEQTPVRITYWDAAGHVTCRVIEPYERDSTAAGDHIVRAMDRLRAKPRTFRLDRVESFELVEGEAFELVREDATDRGEEILTGRLVRYHGSKRHHHGVWRVQGRCDCPRCEHWGDVRWRLVGRDETDPNADPVLWSVRRESFTPITPAKAEAIERDAREAEPLARIRAEIAAVEPEGYGVTARGGMRWDPDCPIFTP